MKILAIDTATNHCSVALLLDDGECRQRQQEAPSGHSKLVIGMARELLGDAGLALADLDLLAVDIGPGSFTGLRVGIGVAQGLAYGAGLPAAGIVSLAALARDLPGVPVIAALDARMGQVYWGVYRDGEALIEPRVDDPTVLAMALEEISWEANPVAVGNGWSSYEYVMPRQVAGHAVERSGVLVPEAHQVALAAADAGKGGSPLQLGALYVRNRVAEKPSPV